MKKNTLKAFTLVEMLIVIVIIGILIAALMPRMSAAQGRARDVSRKTALSNIQSAIVTSQTDKGKRPKLNEGAKTGMDVSKIENELRAAGMNGVPKDPLTESKVEGLGGTGGAGEFRYMVTKRNGTVDAGFVLMAKTEVEGGSNWVYCGGTPSGLSGGKIDTNTDLKDIVLCTTLTKTGTCLSNTGACQYKEEGQLRYIVTY